LRINVIKRERENTPLPPFPRGISANVIWGENVKRERKRKRGKCKRERKKGKKKEKGEGKR
jgi:hypothetical protein